MEIMDALGTLFTPSGRDDPYPIYAALRAHGPIVEANPDYVIVTGHAVVDQVLRHPGLSVQDTHVLDRVMPPWRVSRAMTSLAASMLITNPPDHTRLRRLAAGVFTARRVAALREAITGHVHTLIDAMARAGGAEVDFMAEFAYPLPVRVICDLLGVPASDHGWFRDRAGALTMVLEPLQSMSQLTDADVGAGELEEYFTELIRVRRRAPGDDLTSALVAAHDADGDRLTGDELLANLILLLVAGFETTTNLLGNGLMVLLRHPVHAARLRADHTLAPAYVEELLRYDSPVQLTGRWPTVPTEIGGVEVRPYAEILLLLGAANRDPARFPDPDRFDPDRPGNQPISFGGGVHYCLGAPLARLEAQLAFPLLLARLPELTPVGAAIRRDRLNLRGYASLPLFVGAPAPAVDWTG